MSLAHVQAALHAPLASADALERTLHELELENPPLRSIEIYREAAGGLLVLLSFEDSRSFTVQRIRVALLARAASAEFTDLDHFEGASREEFVRAVHTRPLLGRGSVAQAFVDFRQQSPTPALRIGFDSVEALLQTWARHVGEGCLWVPSSRPIEGEHFNVVLATGGDDYVDNVAHRVHRPEPLGHHGVWLEIHPAPPLQALLTRAQNERRDGPRRAPARPVERYEGDLDVAIGTLPELAAMWTTDLSHGGLFIHTSPPPQLRARIKVHLTLPDGEVLSLAAEVVHRVLSGPRVGAGVQFTDVKPPTFAHVRELLAAPVRKPRVLVVDDEAIWRSTLVRVLKALDCDVVLAKDGREGMLKLIDGYFDLDLVVLDLHMPELDGRALIDRVRRLGGDQAVKIFLFSATTREELASLGEPGLATAVFSKLDPLEVLASQLARELGRTWPPPAERSAA